MFVKCNYFNYCLIIGSVYLNRKFNILYCLDSLQILIDNLRDKYENAMFIIGGDFNSRLGEDNSIHEALEYTCLRSQR